MSPTTEFVKWYDTTDVGILLSACATDDSAAQMLYAIVREAFLLGYTKCANPSQEDFSCLENLPLVSLGPDSACR